MQTTRSTLDLSAAEAGQAGLAKQFSQIEGVNIAGLCDPDQSRVEIMKLDYPKAETWIDLRDLMASDNIDVGGDCDLQPLALPGGDLGHGSRQRCLCGKTIVAFAMGRTANGRRRPTLQPHLPGRDSAAFGSDAGRNQKVSARRKGAREDHLCSCQPLWSSQLDRQTRHAVCRSTKALTTICGWALLRTNRSFATNCNTIGTGIGIPVRAKWATGVSIVLDDVRNVVFQDQVDLAAQDFWRRRTCGLE